MAYKFQLGKAILSGSITAEEGFDANSQEATNFATISNGGSDITIAENAEVLGNVRISGSNALELGDNQHAIKNLADNLEFQVGGNTKLEVKSSETEAKQHILVSGSQEIRFGDSNHKIFKADGVNNLELHANNTKILELRSTQIDAERHIQISGSQELRFGGTNSAIFKASGVENLELKANGATRLEIQSGQIDAKTHLRMSASQEVQFENNQYSVRKDGTELKFKRANSDEFMLTGTGAEFHKGQIKLTGSGVDHKVVFGAGNAYVQGTSFEQIVLKGNHNNAVFLKDASDNNRLLVANDSIRLQGDLRIGALGGTTYTFLDEDRTQLTLSSSADIGVEGDTDLLSLAADVLTVNGAVSATELTGALANSIDAGAGITMDLFDNTGNSTVSISNGAITNAMLSGSIQNGKLLNSDVTIGSTTVALGATQTSFSGLTGLDFTEADASIGASIGANNLTLGGSTSTVIVAGDLTVQGTTTTVDSTTINISSSFTFEGPADDYETTLDAGTPVQDATIYLPQISGSGAQTGYLLALANDPGTDALTATRANLDLMAAGAGSSVSLQGADGIVVFDSSDSDNPKKVLLSDVSALSGRLDVNSKADSDSLEVGMNYFADLSANATVTLPASTGMSVGDVIYVKARNLTNNAVITVNTQASAQKVDGVDSVVLESPYAAITLVYVALNDFRIV